MTQLKNSDVTKQVINTLINTTKRKSTEDEAVMKMNSLIKKLETNYDFLQYIEIKDTRFEEEDDIVDVMSEIDSVPAKDVGKALYTVISTMSNSFDKHAGRFLLQEFRRNVGGEYISTLREMGADIDILLLEYEVGMLEKS